MEKFKFLAKNKISSLPRTPGVYAFKSTGKILYVGKARNIKERVKNHFQQPSYKDKFFIEKIQKIGYLKTESEIEALILEANLIKKHQPRFNTMWRDDKNYFFVAITQENFPRVFITHQPLIELKIKNLKLKIKYIGPFVDGRALKQTLTILRKIFPFRTCNTPGGGLPKKPCLWYQLGRCPAPCILNSKTSTQIPNLKSKSKKEYQRNIRNLIKIFQGKKTNVLYGLKKEMQSLSRSQDFERAAKVRDQINSLENILQNAQIFQDFLERKTRIWKEIETRLKQVLGTKKSIKRIEGYDISNIQGVEATGAMVVFEKGLPKKQDYRKFKIKIAGKPDDIAMIKEMLFRRFNHLEWQFPDLILVDGGKAQLNAVIKAQGTRNKGQRKKDIKVVALAKRKNELYLENKERPLSLENLPQDIANLFLRIRDEAHRFAISYHKLLRSKTLNE